MNEIQRFFLRNSFIFFLLLPLFFLYSDADIRGQVADSALTHPLKDVRVLLKSNSLQAIVQEATTDIYGGYAFENLPAGEYQIHIEIPDHYVAVSPHPMAVSLDDLPIQANFFLGIPGGIMGSVIDSTTKAPVVHAHVDVMRGNMIIASSLTDEQGKYSINGLAPRPSIIRVSGSYFQSSMQLAVPIANKMITVDFSLQHPPGGLKGKIVNIATGKSVNQARIDILKQGMIIDSVQSNDDGTYLISELPPGKYHVNISAKEYGVMIQEILIDTSQLLTADFALEPLGSVKGQVIHNLTGQPVVGASVGMWQNDELVASTHTDKNGFFYLRGLKESQIVVQAHYFYDQEQRVSILPSQTTTLNFILFKREPTPPKRVVVVVSYKYFAHRVNRTHIVKWRESADPSVVAYRIYRDGKFIAEVSADKSFVYKDRWRSGKERKYEVTAINQFGQESLPEPDEGIEDRL